MNLNELEAIKAALIIKELKPDKVYVDSPHPVANKFEIQIRRHLPQDLDVEIICEHQADVTYPVASAASIVAKVKRDSELRKIEKVTGIELGVGYPHDIKSTNGLKNNMRNKAFMKHVRRSWSTYSRIKEEVEQKKLIDY